MQGLTNRRAASQSYYQLYHLTNTNKTERPLRPIFRDPYLSVDPQPIIQRPQNGPQFNTSKTTKIESVRAKQGVQAIASTGSRTIRAHGTENIKKPERRNSEDRTCGHEFPIAIPIITASQQQPKGFKSCSDVIPFQRQGKP